MRQSISTAQCTVSEQSWAYLAFILQLLLEFVPRKSIVVERLGRNCVLRNSDLTIGAVYVHAQVAESAWKKVVLQRQRRVSGLERGEDWVRFKNQESPAEGIQETAGRQTMTLEFWAHRPSKERDGGGLA